MTLRFRVPQTARLIGIVALATVAACTAAGETRDVSFGASPSGGASGGAARLTAPSIESPGGDLQLGTLRPTLTVRNGTSDQSGARTYEFQVSDRTDFTNSGSTLVVVSRSGVAEGSGGTTSLTLEQDLPATSKMFWRARLVQGTSTSDWSEAGTFRTKRVGFNRSNELFDPLIHNETVGTLVGAGAFVDGQGIRLDNQQAYVRYQLPNTVAAGEFSVDVRGLRPNGPGDKLKILTMHNSTGDGLNSKYNMSVQYRGIDGNPDNCVSFKAVWGDDSVRLEPHLGERSSSVFSFDPNKTYHFQAIWTSNSIRVVIKDGGVNGSVIYDRSEFAPGGTGPYAPNPHFAFIGTNNAVFSSIEAGTWPGVVYSNVWLGSGPRPDNLK
jgi:hypothetical protein